MSNPQNREEYEKKTVGHSQVAEHAIEASRVLKGL